MLWAKHDVGAYARRSRSGHKVWHFVKGGAHQKPWFRVLSYHPPRRPNERVCTKHACEAYERITSQLSPTLLDSGTSACARAYQDVRRALEANRVACCPSAFGGLSAERFFGKYTFQPHEITDVF